MLREFDTDGDGILTRDELIDALNIYLKVNTDSTQIVLYIQEKNIPKDRALQISTIINEIIAIIDEDGSDRYRLYYMLRFNPF